MAEETISVDLKADSKSFVSAFNDATKAAKTLGDAAKYVSSKFQAELNNSLSFVKKWAGGIAASVAAVGLKATLAVKNFSGFEAAMSNIATVADPAAMSIGAIGDRLRKMSLEFPKSAEELAAGMYEVTSSGFKGEEAFKVLTAATQFGVAGLTDMGSAVKGVSSILNAYQMNAGDAAHVTDIMFKAVQVGQMSGADFVQQIGDWSSGAAALGISVESASAALAQITLSGKNAAASATSLAAIMRQLNKPTEALSDAYKRMGVDSGKAAIEQFGLVGTLEQLWSQSGKSEAAFSQMLNEQEAYSGAIGLVTNRLDEWKQADADFNNKAETSGVVVGGMAKQMDTLAAQSQKLSNEWKEMQRNLGELLAPIAKFVVGSGAQFLDFFNSLPEPIRSVVNVLGLVAPAVAILGGLFIALKVRAMLFGTALQFIAKSSAMIGKFPALQKLMMTIGESSKGIIPTFLTLAKKFIQANGAMKMAMLKMAASGVAVAGAFTLVGIALVSTINAFQDATARAKELGNAIDVNAQKSIHSMKDLSAVMVDLEQRKTKEPVDVGLFRAIQGELQNASPWNANTVSNHQAMGKELTDLIQKYEDLSQAIAMGSESLSGLDFNQETFLTGLNSMIDQGKISMDEFIEQWQKLEEITASGAVMKAKDAAAAAGGSREGLDWQKFADPRIVEQYNAIAGAFNTTADSAKAMGAAEEEALRIQQTYAANGQELQSALVAIGDAASTAAEKVAAYSGILDATLGNTTQLRDMRAAVGEGIRAVGDALKENGPAFDEYSERGAKVQAALSQAAQAAQAYAAKVYEQNESTDAANKALAIYSQGIIAAGQDAGLNTEQLREMIGVMGLTPEQIQTIVNLPGADPALAKLFGLEAGMNALNGKSATMFITIKVGLDNIASDGERHGANTGPIQAADQANKMLGDMQKSISGALSGALNNRIPKKAGGGGGGGGGGTPKWKPTAEQLRNMEKYLSAPLEQLLTGDAMAGYISDFVKNTRYGGIRAEMEAGVNRTAAGILKAAQASGEDPKDKLDELADTYIKLADAIGEAAAQQSLQQISSLDQFKSYTDAVLHQIDLRRNKEDYEYDNQKSDNATYKALLQERLHGLEEYSSDWVGIMNQITAVDEDAKQKELDRLADVDRMHAVRYEMQEESLADYKGYLVARLEGLEKYSDEYMSIWHEINSLDEVIADQVKDFQNAADDIAKAMEDMHHRITDPIMQATDLISAFGGQMDITGDQITGFFEHMKEGTRRWIDTIDALKQGGLNASFLNQLIQSGPGSLSLAQSILGMGAEGLSYINQAQSDIDAMASNFGTRYSTATIGEQINNNYQVNIGDITVEVPTTVATQQEVQQMIDGAMVSLSEMINSGRRS